jgi:hypothetical protein
MKTHFFPSFTPPPLATSHSRLATNCVRPRVKEVKEGLAMDKSCSFSTLECPWSSDGNS